MASISCRVLLLAAAACVSCADNEPRVVSAPEAERWEAPSGSPYAFLRGGGIIEDDMPALWDGLPYESLTLTRGGCYGTCPVYEVKLTRGTGVGPGSASYQGDAFVEREGPFEGTIDIWSYGHLCELFDHLGFLELNESYAANWTDDETVVIEAEHASGVYRVLDYGHQGPPELVALHLAIDATIERIEWEAAQD